MWTPGIQFFTTLSFAHDVGTSFFAVSYVAQRFHTFVSVLASFLEVSGS